jgi:hypothetical protein
MPSLKVTLFFQGPDKPGWSESFYYNGGIAEPAYKDAVNALIVGRCAILTSNCSIVRARLSSTFYREPLIINPNFGAGTPGTESSPTASETVALLLLIQGSPNGINRPFLQGIPARVVDYDTYTPDSIFNSNMTTFLNVLFNGQWNVVGTANSAAPTHWPITPMSPTPTFPRGYNFLAGTGSPVLNLGETIRVSGTSVPGYSGLKRVTKVIAANSYQVGGAAPPVADTGVAPYFTIMNGYDNPIQTIQPDGITTRKLGRPFGLRRGRRPTLYSLRQ